MNYFLRLLLVLPFVLLAGCCANDACGCNDLLADSIYFKLDLNSFRRKDIDTVYLARYSLTSSSHAIDSLQLTRKQLVANAIVAKLDTSFLVLSNTSPFSPGTTGGKLSQYNYVLYVPKGDSLKVGPNNLQPRLIYSIPIRSITIGGQYKADGCCTCYANNKKTLLVNNVFYDVTETAGMPIPILLHR